MPSTEIDMSSAKKQKKAKKMKQVEEEEAVAEVEQEEAKVEEEHEDEQPQVGLYFRNLAPSWNFLDFFCCLKIINSLKKNFILP